MSQGGPAETLGLTRQVRARSVSSGGQAVREKGEAADGTLQYQREWLWREVQYSVNSGVLRGSNQQWVMRVMPTLGAEVWWLN